MRRTLLSISLILLPGLLLAQIGVDNSTRMPVSGPVPNETVRISAATSNADTAAPAMSADDARSVYTKADRYYGRSNWTATEFDSVMKESGIDSRDGQHAAIASILLRMRDGDDEGARARLDTLFSMPGYVIDNDIAQILSAVDVILNTANRVDTVFVEKEVPPSQPESSPLEPSGKDRLGATAKNPTSLASMMPKAADSTRWASDSLVRLAAANAKRASDSTRLASDSLAQVAEAQPKSPAQSTNTNSLPPQGTNGMTAQPLTQPSAQPMSDPSANALAALEARLRALEGKVSELSTNATSQDVDPQSEDEDAEAEFESSPTTRFNNEWPEEYITRRCYTIEIERHADRAIAEQRIDRLRKTYKRTRLAIDMTSDQPFVVIVGYYQTERSAIGDIPMVNRTTKRACRVMETTIAEKL